MTGAPTTPPKRLIYLSFSHKDQGVGRRLKRALEQFRTPASLVRAHKAPKRFGPVFVDRRASSAGARLSDLARQELEASAFFVVACTPHTATSRWVNQEIAAFKHMGRADRIIAVIMQGDEASALPLTLRFQVDADGAPTDVPETDLGGVVSAPEQGLSSAVAGAAAIMLGVEPDKLKGAVGPPWRSLVLGGLLTLGVAGVVFWATAFGL